MIARRLLIAVTTSIVACLEFTSSALADVGNRDHLVATQASPEDIRPIAVDVSKQRQSIGGKVLILIPIEYAGKRELQILNERIKSALIFAQVPYDWTKSFYYAPEIMKGGDPHQVYISVVGSGVNLYQIRAPEVPRLSGFDMKQFADEAQLAAGVSSSAQSGPGSFLNTGNPAIDRSRMNSILELNGGSCRRTPSGGMFAGHC